jgi:transcriptional activator, tipA family, putative
MDMYHIKEASQLLGTSIRTLHHYDKIGLLMPKKDNNGYRIYSRSDIELLHIILTYRSLGLSLKEIFDLLNRSEGNTLSLLQVQLQYLHQEQERLALLLSTLLKTLQAHQEKNKIDVEELFVGFKNMSEVVE